MIIQILHLIEARLHSRLKFKHPQAGFQRTLAKQGEFCFGQLQVCETTPKRHRAARPEFCETKTKWRGEAN
jgi:hypothetical protein